MPALGNALDFAKYEGRQFRAHQLGTAPSSPVTGQMYYNTADNTLYWWDGTAWQSGKGGPSAPTGAATGDLTGSYPAPQIAANVIVNADVNTAAAIAYSKLSLTNAIVNGDINTAAAIAWSKINTALAIMNADVNASAAIAYSKLNLANSIVGNDIVNGTIPNTKLTTDPLLRSNHTGTQLASSISNFDVQVRTSTLNQMAVPTAAVAMNNQKITGLGAATNADEAVRKDQLDAVVTGLDVKASCRVASIIGGNVTLPPGGTTLTIDTVALANGDRVLLKDQTTSAQNGIYTVSGIGTSVVLTRATDADTSAEVTAGLFTFVSEGAANQDSGWYLATNNPITLGTTGLVFVQFSGAGQIVDGAGLLKTGNTLDVRVDGASIEISADILRVKALGITAAMLQAASVNLATTTVTGTLPVANGGTGQTAAKAARETGMAASGYYTTAVNPAAATWTITQATHLLRASRGLIVQVQDEATGAIEFPDQVVAANGDVTVTYGAAQTANTKRTTIIG